MKKPSLLMALLTALLVTAMAGAPAAETRITVQADQVLHPVSRYLTGACIEDVNHEIYGGLYSQMVFGESFQEAALRLPEDTPALAGLFGAVSCRAPAIDAMAAEGLRFTDHYAGSPVCAPSRCVLMTGPHTGRCQIRNNQEVRPMGQAPLRAGTVTVAGRLQEAGYATRISRPWHAPSPMSRCFTTSTTCTIPRGPR